MDYEDLDYEIINSTVNRTEYDYTSTPVEIALEVVEFSVCFVGTAVDILMIYIILRYKNMKKPVNVYIMNWLICDSLFILAEPSEYRLFMLMRGLNTKREIICVMLTTMMIIRTLDIIFMLVIMFQWFFDKTKILVFERYPYRIILGAWIFGLIEFIFSVISCFDNKERMISYLEDKILFFLIIIFMLCFLRIHCLRRCANPFSSTSSLPVALLSGFVLSWTAMIILTIFSQFHSHELFRSIYYLGQFCISLYPILMFYLFYKIDPQFATCTRILFKCSRSEEVATSMSFDVISASEEDIT